MIDTKQAIKDAKRSEYFGRSKQTLLMKASFKFEYSIKHLLNFLPQWRHNKVERTLTHLFEVGERVNTYHGAGTVIKSYKSIASNGEDGFVSVDVRYDTAPADATSYPDVGHYNQIFLEREV